MEISSIGVELMAGPRQGQTVEFGVTFQSGNKISLIIPSKEKDLVDGFEKGMELRDMQCYSPLAVFNTKGVVTGLNMIMSGTKRGDFVLDITLEAT